MSGIPTRRVGPRGASQPSLYERTTSRRAGANAASTSRIPPGPGPMRATSTLAPSNIPTSCNPRGPGQGPQRSMSRLQPPSTSRSQIPSLSSIPRSVSKTGAIPKASAKSVTVEKQTKSGSQMVTKTSSRKITKGDIKEAARSKAQRTKKSTLVKDGEDNEESEWGQGRATTSVLEQQLAESLLEVAAQRPKTPLIATTGWKTAMKPPMMMTKEGLIPIETQVISTKSVTKQPGMPDIIGRDVTTIETISPDMAERTEVVMSRVSPFRPGAHATKTKEAVIVQNKVALAAGYKQTIKTVTYEGDPEDIRQAPVLPSPQDVAKMVREETALINETLALQMPDVKRVSPSTYPIRKKALGYSFNKDTVAGVESRETSATCTAMPEDLEEPTPEMIAEMMNIEERGLTLGDVPSNLYNYLFPGPTSTEPKVAVASAVSFPLHDVVIPDKIPNMSMDVQNIEEVMNVTLHAAVAASGNQNDNSYCATVGEEPLVTKNAARKGGKTKRKRVTPIANEKPPWGAIEDVEPVIDLVGAPLAVNRTIQQETEEECDPLMEGIEFLLQTEAPQHYSQIQMRGTQKPDWFPGYVMALPNVPNLVTLARSPSEVFGAAWQATQPDIFNDDSLFII